MKKGFKSLMSTVSAAFEQSGIGRELKALSDDELTMLHGAVEDEMSARGLGDFRKRRFIPSAGLEDAVNRMLESDDKDDRQTARKA